MKLRDPAQEKMLSPAKAKRCAIEKLALLGNELQNDRMVPWGEVLP
jgi:hypothetical protein